MNDANAMRRYGSRWPNEHERQPVVAGQDDVAQDGEPEAGPDAPARQSAELRDDVLVAVGSQLMVQDAQRDAEQQQSEGGSRNLPASLVHHAPGLPVTSLKGKSATLAGWCPKVRRESK